MYLDPRPTRQGTLQLGQSARDPVADAGPALVVTVVGRGCRCGGGAAVACRGSGVVAGRSMMAVVLGARCACDGVVVVAGAAAGLGLGGFDGGFLGGFGAACQAG